MRLLTDPTIAWIAGVRRELLGNAPLQPTAYLGSRGMVRKRPSGEYWWMRELDSFSRFTFLGGAGR